MRYRHGLMVAAVIALLGQAAPALAAEGDLDPSFGGGKVSTAIGSEDDYGRGVALDSQGRIVIAGVTYTGGQEDFGVARFNPDGTLDTSFGPSHTGLVTTPFSNTLNDEGNAVSIDSQGRIVVAGTQFNGANDDFILARYLPNGSLDPSFGGGGKKQTDFNGGSDQAQGVAIDSQDRIVVAGRVAAGSNLEMGLARYRAGDGQLDTSFGSGSTGKEALAIGSADLVGGVALDSQGRIVIAGGYFGPLNYDLAVARFTANGLPDPGFNAVGYATAPLGDAGASDMIHGLAIDGQDRPVMVGQTTVGGKSSLALVRYTSSGQLDPSFDGSGVTTTTFPGALALNAVTFDQQGRIVGVGAVDNPGSGADLLAARYTTGGQLDSSFGSGGLVSTSFGPGDDTASALAIDARDRIVSAGTAVSGNADLGLVRYIGDQAPPGVTIASGPKNAGFTKDRTPTFAFSSPDPLATFSCALASTASSGCGSPFTSAQLKDGKHTFSVSATDPALNVSSASRTFTVDTRKPKLRIKGRSTIAGGSRARFRLKVNEPATLTCKLDRRKARRCKRRYRTPPLAPGKHRLKVTARDRAGNRAVKVKPLLAV